ncbi:hypothetical protein PR202_gb27331 [Eleusine coracana subsp. coracana]|uniref:Uncharacterized protein n=1 Tax=Eleusine coracana subsp. coracana TaxID=191504 RepID=A0AAV5FU87_ELECO|nr:hypothetical protein PR202_gb27331 [Eleusine coracana subsp. coracana]
MVLKDFPFKHLHQASSAEFAIRWIRHLPGLILINIVPCRVTLKLQGLNSSDDKAFGHYDAIDAFSLQIGNFLEKGDHLRIGRIGPLCPMRLGNSLCTSEVDKNRGRVVTIEPLVLPILVSGLQWDIDVGLLLA